MNHKFSYTEKFQLVWALAWPCAIFGLLYSLPRSYFSQMGFSPGQILWIDLSVGLFQLFLFSPWVVRRTVQLHFTGFHFVVGRRKGGKETPGLKYRESLSVTWLLIWRTAMISLIINSALFIAVWMIRDMRPVFFDPTKSTMLSGESAILWYLWEEALSLFIFYLWTVKAAIRKNYAGFVLRLYHAKSLITTA